MIEIRSKVIEDYDGVYEMWINTPEMSSGKKLDFLLEMI